MDDSGKNFNNNDRNFPLIQTKIQIPLQRSDSIIRSRLIKRLHSNLDRKLIVISAPAGYGKSTLLIDFANDTDLPVCWYTIDSFDKDLRVFLDYLIASIKLRFPAFGKQTHKILDQIKDPDRNIYPIVATFVQEIHDSIPEYFILVLEDHHSIEDQEPVNEFLDMFIGFMDENCHLILTSRGLPALSSMSLLIARNQAAGLGQRDLRFTPAEIQNLAHQYHRLRLTIDQAELIAKRSGGWITGLQMIDLSEWQVESDTEYLESISPYLYEYLSKQVFDQQTGEIKEFLLASSVLDDISSDQCTSVLGVKNPNPILSKLVNDNLFIIENEVESNRLRYHDLFINYLRTTFRNLDPARFEMLTRRAADEYVIKGEWERAISRYLSVKDYQSVADVVEQIAVKFYDAGRWNTLADWIDAIPKPILETKPVLLLERAKIHAERGEHSAALRLFERTERIFAETEDKSMAARALAMKGAILRFQGNYHEAILQCQGAFGLAAGRSRQDKLTSALAHKTIGTCLIMLGESVSGRQALNLALHLFEELGFSQDSAMVLHDLGLSLEYSGDLEGAILHYKAALKSWEILGNLSPWANTLNGLGVIYLQLGDYDHARPTLEEALVKARHAQDLRIEAYTLASLADLYRDRQDLENAQEHYNQALQIAYRAHIGFIITYALDGLGNISRMQNDLQKARVRLNKALNRAEEYGSTYEKGLCLTSLGILGNQENDFSTARVYLDKAIDILESSDTPLQLARTLLHRANTAYLSGDRGQSIGCLDDAFKIADKLGFDHFLVQEGVVLEQVFDHAGTQGLRTGQIKKLIERIADYRAGLTSLRKENIQVEAQPILKICALGLPNVVVDGNPVQWPVAKSRDLLFYLLQQVNGRSKEQIGLTFWPEHGPERLDSAFRSTLYRLRRVVYRECVVFEENLYRFNWNSDYTYDVQDYDRLIEKANHSPSPEEASRLFEEGLYLYQDEYLEGVYYDWVIIERERLRLSYLSSIENLASIYVGQRKLHQAVQLYKRLLKQDPYQEKAHRELMRCYYRIGDRAAAIRQYHTCVEMLREELDLTPSQEMEDLYLQIIR